MTLMDYFVCCCTMSEQIIYYKEQIEARGRSNVTRAAAEADGAN